jgi:putative oxidoreductase
VTADDILRVACGLFFLPHLVLKFVFFKDTVAFFRRAGYSNPPVWICLDASAEVVAATMLIGNIYTRWGAYLATALLLVAAISIWRANGPKWRWNRGGPEYAFFWAIMCLIVAHNSTLN